MPAPQPAAGGVGGPPGQWTVGEVMGSAMSVFKEHWLILSLVVFIAQIANAVPGIIVNPIIAAQELQPGDAEYHIIDGIRQIISWIISTFFAVGIIRVFVPASRPEGQGRSPEIGALFRGMDRFFPLLVASLLQGIVVVVGLLLLIVPGIILALGLSLTGYLIVEQNMGPVDAMKESWRLTVGSKLNIFLIGFVGLGVVILGLLACGIGIFPATAYINLMSACIYLRLTNQPVRAPNT